MQRCDSDEHSGSARDIPSPVLAVRVELLVTFAVLAKELHFTRAARELYVSQSGLTRRIHLLERCLGASLLDRTARQVTLTDAGQRLLPHALAVLDAVRAGATAVAAVPSPRTAL